MGHMGKKNNTYLWLANEKKNKNLCFDKDMKTHIIKKANLFKFSVYKCRYIKEHRVRFYCTRGVQTNMISVVCVCVCVNKKKGFVTNHSFLNHTMYQYTNLCYPCASRTGINK